MLCLAVYYLSLRYLTGSPEMPQTIVETSGGKLTIMKPIVNPVETPKDWEIAGKVTIGKTDDRRGLGYTGQRKITQNSLGALHVAYRNKFEGNQEIFVPLVRKDSDGDFLVSGSAKPIYTFGEDSVQRVPSVAVDKSNTVHVVWYGLSDNDDSQDEGRQVYYAASKDFGKTWSTAKNISKVEGYDDEDYWQEHPYILSVGDDELYVVWEGKDKANEEQQTKMVISLDGGSTWSKWKNVQLTPNNTQSRPTMVRDDLGSLHLFAYSSVGADTQQIVHSVSQDRGENWTKWQAISVPKEDSRHASVVYANQKIYVAWRASTSGKAVIRYSVFDKNSWSKPSVVVNSSSNQFFPSIGSNVSGDIAVTWMESPESGDLPKDDPEDGTSYIAILDNSKNSFETGFKLENASLIYPSLPANSFTDDFYIVSLAPAADKQYEVVLHILTH